MVLLKYWEGGESVFVLFKILIKSRLLITNHSTSSTCINYVTGFGEFYAWSSKFAELQKKFAIRLGSANFNAGPQGESNRTISNSNLIELHRTPSEPQTNFKSNFNFRLPRSTVLSTGSHFPRWKPDSQVHRSTFAHLPRPALQLDSPNFNSTAESQTTLCSSRPLQLDSPLCSNFKSSTHSIGYKTETREYDLVSFKWRNNLNLKSPAAAHEPYVGPRFHLARPRDSVPTADFTEGLNPAWQPTGDQSSLLFVECKGFGTNNCMKGNLADLKFMVSSFNS